MQIVVVGGGAAGLMAAGCAARRGHEVTVLEKNARMARKVGITGKGRCNVTNNCTVPACIEHIPGGGRFLYSALSRFSPQDTVAFFEGQGVPLKTERGNRVFPCSDKALDIVDALVRYAREGGCRFRRGRAVSLRVEDGVCTGVGLEDGTVLDAYAVILCTGGLSYPATGSTGDGYRLARQAGHTIVPPRPSLVPLAAEDSFCADMQGLSLKNCAIRAVDNRTGREAAREFGEMLFTHFGLSGPMILSASAHMREMEPGRYTVFIDWKPALSAEQLDSRLLRELDEGKNRDFSHILAGLLPRKSIPVFAALADIPLQKKGNAVTREERRRLAAILKEFPVRIHGFRPVEEAIVTAGGVSLKEVDAKTMASKLVSGLYFAGELLDLDGYTGGFNLQIAFSTGMAAGNSV